MLRYVHLLVLMSAVHANVFTKTTGPHVATRACFWSFSNQRPRLLFFEHGWPYITTMMHQHLRCFNRLSPWISVPAVFAATHVC
jgi:hypothetical protein